MAAEVMVAAAAADVAAAVVIEHSRGANSDDSRHRSKRSPGRMAQPPRCNMKAPAIAQKAVGKTVEAKEARKLLLGDN
jgi:hypothetical protein